MRWQIDGITGMGDARTFKVHYLGYNHRSDEPNVPVSRIPSLCRPSAKAARPAVAAADVGAALAAAVNADQGPAPPARAAALSIDQRVMVHWTARGDNFFLARVVDLLPEDVALVKFDGGTKLYKVSTAQVHDQNEATDAFIAAFFAHQVKLRAAAVPQRPLPPPPPPQMPSRAEWEAKLAELQQLRRELDEERARVLELQTEALVKDFQAGEPFSHCLTVIREMLWRTLVYRSVARDQLNHQANYHLTFPLKFLPLLQELLPPTNRLQDPRRRRGDDIKMQAKFVDPADLALLFGSELWWCRKFSDAFVSVRFSTNSDAPSPLPFKIELHKSNLPNLYTLSFRFYRASSPAALAVDAAPLVEDYFSGRRAADLVRGVETVMSDAELVDGGYANAFAPAAD